MSKNYEIIIFKKKWCISIKKLTAIKNGNCDTNSIVSIAINKILLQNDLKPFFAIIYNSNLIVKHVLDL